MCQCNPIEKVKLVAKGFCIGSADVIPGVSGGTMAFILGIYPQLINAIKSFDGKCLRMFLSLNFGAALGRPHLNFLFPLAMGIGIAVVFFTRVVSLPILIKTQAEIIYGLFFGLIIASIIFFCRHIGWAVLIRRWCFFISGVLFGTCFVVMVPASTPDAGWFVFLCGALAISAMILPGVSGAFVLLMMKKYAYIFNGIGHFDLAIMLPFFLGVVVGAVLFSRLLSYLLKTFYQQTIVFILGVLIASLYVIWPFQQRLYETVRGKDKLISSVPFFPETFSHQVFYSVAMMVLGFVIVILLNRFSTAKEQSY